MKETSTATERLRRKKAILWAGLLTIPRSLWPAVLAEDAHKKKVRRPKFNIEHQDGRQTTSLPLIAPENYVIEAEIKINPCDRQAVWLCVRNLTAMEWPFDPLAASTVCDRRVRKCHSGPLGTDQQRYNVGTGKGREQEQEFDTATVVEVWRTAPHVYDGRAATIEGMLVERSADDKHGRTSDLTEKQIADPAEFVLSQ